MRRYGLALAVLTVLLVVPALVAQGAEDVSWGDVKSQVADDDVVRPAAKKAAKVDVCHASDEGGFRVINISGNAVQAHLDNHGDALDFIAGEDGSCVPVPDNCALATCGYHSYTICQGQQFKSQSEASCGDLGMELAFMDDLEENTCVVDAALAAFGYVNFEETSYWIANTKDNSPIFPWAAGEPNTPSDRDIHILRYNNAPYGWNDVSGSVWTWGWVCESTD